MSSSDIAVSVRGLSKSYTIAQDQEKHVTLAETMLSRMKNPFQRAKTQTFWALKDVEFDIKKGDVVGIIGRNGAGKSTLLKILSRITEPTTGQIDLFGRVGSLLEVGTGFHPELTGRENIFLNGAILGMSKAEIRKQFDAIVDFAGVEKFLDTPVKRYSSGMYVRLAFAVAAHLNSEILIVDEVLAVGDAEFQKKCLGKMQDVSKNGRTVLFVSHNMGAIASLCSKAILFCTGKVLKSGEIRTIIESYSTSAIQGIIGVESRHARLIDIYLANGSGNRITDIFINQYIELHIIFEPTSGPIKGALILEVIDAYGVRIGACNSMEEGLPWININQRIHATVVINTIRFTPRRYRLRFCIVDKVTMYFDVPNALDFDVLPQNLPNAPWSYGEEHPYVRIADSLAVDLCVTVSSPQNVDGNCCLNLNGNT